MAMTEQRRRQIAQSFGTLSDGTLARLAEDFKRSGDTQLDDMAEAEIVRRRETNAPAAARCCFCAVERDDVRATLACVAPSNRTAFHHFVDPAPAARIATLETLSYAADKLDETAAILRAIARVGLGADLGGPPCDCPPERSAAVPEREPGVCDLCGGRKIDAVNAVRR